MFPAPSPLPTALGVLCISLSFLFLSLSFPLNFLSWDGGWGLKLSQGIANTGEMRGEISAPALVPKSEERRDMSRFLPALTEYSIYFFSLLPLRSFLSLCLRCTTSDEVVTLTHTHVIWDSRTRVPNQPF